MTVYVSKDKINIREKLTELEPKPEVQKKHQQVDVLGNRSGLSLYTFDYEMPEGYAEAGDGDGIFDETKRKFGLTSFKAQNTNSWEFTSAPLSSYPFSMSCWVYNENWSSLPGTTNKVLLNTSIGGQRVTLTSVDWNNTGSNTQLSIMYGGTNHWVFGDSSMLPNNTWFQIVYSIVGSNNDDHAVYINGFKLDATNNGGAHGGSGGWVIGGNAAQSEIFTGWIDQMRLFNKALTPAEVQELYMIEAMGL